MTCRGALLLLALVLLPRPSAAWPACRTRPLPSGAPAALGFDAALTGDLDALLADAVATGQTESAGALVLRKGHVVYRGSAGSAHHDTVWDLASVTKAVVTATAVAQLSTGVHAALRLDEPAATWLPWMRGADKQAITARQLLLHTSGLHSEVYRGALTDGRDVILSRIRRSRMRARPGQRYRYSDIGYIVLGELVAAVSKQPLDRYAQQRLFAPLGMCDSGFRPPARLSKRLVSHWPEGNKLGQVYDPLAARMGGVAGHAGLYSTLDDLARFGQMLLQGGALQGQRVLAPAAVRRMVRPRRLPGRPRSRALGWLVNDPPAGTTRKLSRAAFGHDGYTGTSLWIDPTRQLVLVLLTNRTRISPLPDSRPLRGRFHNLVLTALSRRPARPVRTGLDNLVASGYRGLRGRRIGLITNRTAVDHTGGWIVDRLARAPGVQLQALFVPEHGLGAKVDRLVRDSKLRWRGRSIPIYSLFGRRRRPSDATLERVQTLVFDVAAVGSRYYTYLATMGWAMEEAARRKLPFVVLDRPVPVGGTLVQGPVATDHRPSSANYHPLPVRYGMTMGELARMFNRERHIGVQLTVVPVTGWRRAQLQRETGLPWVNPSPNIRSWRQALLYAGLGLLEGTNVSVGRGTAAPFQLLGAPWIDGPALARWVNRAGLKGVHAVAVSFTPRARPYRGRRCHGVRLLLTDATTLDAPALGVALALGLRHLHAGKWNTTHLHRMVRHPETVRAILAGESLGQIVRGWAPLLRRFAARRKRYLLYR